MFVRQTNDLQTFYAALRDYAESHEGSFPYSAEELGNNREIWEVPGGAGLKYCYRRGLNSEDGTAILVYEPELHEQCVALQVDGWFEVSLHDYRLDVRHWPLDRWAGSAYRLAGQLG